MSDLAIEKVCDESIIIINSLKEYESKYEYVLAKRALVRLIHTVGVGTEEKDSFVANLKMSILDLRVAQSENDENEVIECLKHIKDVCDEYCDYLDGNIKALASNGNSIRSEALVILYEALINTNNTILELDNILKDSEEEKDEKIVSKAKELAINHAQERKQKSAYEKEALKLFIYCLKAEKEQNAISEILSIVDAINIRDNISNSKMLAEYISKARLWMSKTQNESKESKEYLSKVFE
ncbi:MAG: hypothetical protein MJ236_01580 [Clostridia bacterium]|nr:hypothetical protein [Clostridia bacterium]